MNFKKQIETKESTCHRNTLLIGESENLFRETFKCWLGNIPSVKTVHAGASPTRCLELAFHYSPELVLLPSKFSEKTSPQVAVELKQLCPETKIAFYIGEISDMAMSGLLNSKPDGLISVHDTPEQITELIEGLLSGVSSHSYRFKERVQKIQNDISGPHRKKRILGLSMRQIEVLVYLAQGHTVKEIASIMHLSAKSVDSHKYRIMKRLDIHDRVHLARFAIREGLIEA